MTEICHILSYLQEKEERKKTAIVEFRLTASLFRKEKAEFSAISSDSSA
ncbi:hypothetical protein D068_cds12710 [Bacillus atrophaeus UCMB-5137]|nr:hypothetical protein D068_cds12710 [Bacillus atrophaeus UCMB-5137]